MVATIGLGLLVTMFGLTSPAAAAKPNTFKLTLCHRTNAPDNPYRMISVSVDASNGVIVGPDHTGHPGPAFDFSGETDYPAPHNGDQWGDIIPPYEFDGGSFPGMNYDAVGEAIWANGCQGAEEEPPEETCPEGETWVDDNEDGIIDDDECQIPVDPEPNVAAAIACATPTGMKLTLTNTGAVSGLVDITSGGALVHDDVVVPVGEPVERVVEVAEDTAYAIDVVDVQTFAGTRDCEQVEDVVITNTPKTPVTPEVQPTQVAGVQVTQAQELPRTGNTTLPLIEIGVGLMLMGAGALLVGKGQTSAI